MQLLEQIVETDGGQPGCAYICFFCCTRRNLMTKNRKRVILSVAMVLGAAFLVGLIMSLALGGAHGHKHPVLNKLLVGTVGPFFLPVAPAGFSLLFWCLIAGPAVLAIVFTVKGIAKNKMLPALLGAIPLALLWLGSVFMTCILSNMS